jgi:hypothetical protein
MVIIFLLFAIIYVMYNYFIDFDQKYHDIVYMIKNISRNKEGLIFEEIERSKNFMCKEFNFCFQDLCEKIKQIPSKEEPKVVVKNTRKKKND